MGHRRSPGPRPVDAFLLPSGSKYSFRVIGSLSDALPRRIVAGGRQRVARINI